ncbi:unnamed protein product [Didymodactylos carnosus]|uniref:Uncharacterized protein n=1 Tax=Didymodactylos carnosus TaxID=1234261 RepID=A0A8S2T709_9BILA|nr:unnamed protein product [Didymodactylos carnosus]CAF4267377.1 unnamed protein product [Didymodactylos carnosus]
MEKRHKSKMKKCQSYSVSEHISIPTISASTTSTNDAVRLSPPSPPVTQEIQVVDETRPTTVILSPEQSVPPPTVRYSQRQQSNAIIHQCSHLERQEIPSSVSNVIFMARHDVIRFYQCFASEQIQLDLRDCEVDEIEDLSLNFVTDYSQANFDVKLKYFRHELTVIKGRIGDHPKVPIRVRRNRVFDDSFKELKQFSKQQWKQRFDIEFRGSCQIVLKLSTILQNVM